MRFVVLAAVLLLAACGSSRESNNQGSSSWFGSLFGSSSSAATTETGAPQVPNGTVLGVNGYLWTATLDTLKFMPLASEDPSGGVIITDWYSAPEIPNERVKVTVYILDRRLRADAVRASVFRQVRQGAEWTNAAVNPETATKLEDAILARARELRLADVDKQ